MGGGSLAAPALGPETILAGLPYPSRSPQVPVTHREKREKRSGPGIWTSICPRGQEENGAHKEPEKQGWAQESHEDPRLWPRTRTISMPLASWWGLPQLCGL